MFSACIELDVINRKTGKGSFFEGDHSINVDGVKVDSMEVIPYSITLRHITDQAQA